MMKPTAYECSYVFIFGVGDLRECDQIRLRRLVDTEGCEYLLNVDDARKQPSCLDPADLALAHATAPG